MEFLQLFSDVISWENQWLRPKRHLFTQAGKVIQIKFLLETATQSDLQDMKNKPCSIVYLVILLQTLYLRTYHLQI